MKEKYYDYVTTTNKKTIKCYIQEIMAVISKQNNVQTDRQIGLQTFNDWCQHSIESLK